MTMIRSWTVPLAIATLVVGAALALAWSLFDVASPAAPVGASVPALPIRVAGEALSIPGRLIRFSDQRKPGDHSRVDLALAWPSLDPATPGVVGEADDADAATIFLSIEPRDGGLDTTTRVASVYARFFDGDPLPQPAGLIGQRLKPGSGYEDELLVFEPGSVRPFAARCFAGEKAGVPTICMREVLVGRSLVAGYRFPHRLLGEWQDLDRRLDSVVRSLLPS